MLMLQFQSRHAIVLCYFKQIHTSVVVDEHEETGGDHDDYENQGRV